MLARSRHQRPPRPRAPVPAPPFPRPSRPQPRTPQPRSSRRHSGSRRRRQPQVAAIPSKNAIYRPAISSKKLAKGRHGPAGLAPIAEGDNIGIDAADDEDDDRERRDEVRGPPPLGVAHVVVLVRDHQPVAGHGVPAPARTPSPTSAPRATSSSNA